MDQGCGPVWRRNCPRDRRGFDELPRDTKDGLLARLEEEARQLVKDRNGVLARYATRPESRDGMLVNGDIVNQLLPTVEENPTLGLAGLHVVGLETLMNLFQAYQWVEERAIELGRNRPVLVTMGGQASGKTSMATFVQGAGAILDAPNTDSDGIVKRLTKLLGQGREVWTAWVHRNPRHALHSMLLRAVEEGRPVHLSQMGKAHYGVPQAFEAAGRAFRGQPRLHLFHVQNLGAPEEVVSRGGRMDREGKDALDVLGGLPPWGGEDYRTCLIRAFMEALEGRRGWSATPPARDVVSFLCENLSGAERGCAWTLAEARIFPARGTIVNPHGNHHAPLSTLETDLVVEGEIPEMLARAIQEGIAWNEGRLAQAFAESYGAPPPSKATLFD